MSRCFPFPPPGYEKKPRSGEHGDLLAKEKHREKKHKKEKDKDKSKDKHNEKKERKEKHRDKKDKDRDRERNKIPEDQRTEIHHKDKLLYDSRKASDFRDSKFTEELGRRIRHEQGATNCLVEDISATPNKRIDSMGASTSMVNKMSTNVPVSIQRDEKLTPLFSKRTEVTEISTSTEKQKATSSEKVHDITSTERRRNECIIPQVQKRTEIMGNATVMEKRRAATNHKVGDFSNLVERTEGMFTVNSIQREMVTGNNLVSNTIGSSTKRNDKENFTSIPRRIESIGAAPAMEKGRFVVPNVISTEQRKAEQMELQVKNGTDKKTEAKEKSKEKKAEDDNHKVGDFSNLVERTEGMFTVNSIQREMVTGNNLVSNTIGSSTKRNDKENFTSIPRRIESIGAAPSMEKGRFVVPNVISAEQRKAEQMELQVKNGTDKKTEAKEKSKEKKAEDDNHKFGDFSNLVERTEGMFTVNSIQRDMVTGNNLVSNTIGSSTKRNDQTKENFTSIPRRIESIGAAPATEKGRFVVPNVISTEQRKAEQMELQVKNGTDKKTEAKEKSKEKKAEDDKREGRKDSERKEKRRKDKDKNRDKDKKKEEKKAEKKRRKREHKLSKHDTSKENEIKDQIPNLNCMTLAPHVENINAGSADGPSKTGEFEGYPDGSDGPNKKRKEFEMNGFLNESQHDGRPSKLPRTSVASFHPPDENGRQPNFASGCSPIKLGGINNTKVGRGLDNNGKHINGKIEVQPSAVRKQPHIPPVVDSSSKVAVRPSPRLKPPIPPVVDSSSKAAVQPSAVTKSLIPTVVDSSSKPAVRPSPVLKPPIPPVVGSSGKAAIEPSPVQKPSIPPHPDTKYLSTVYAVPKMEELSESEDLDWLFNGKKPPSTAKIEAEGTPPRVGAKGLRIESADVFALPYVIPF